MKKLIFSVAAICTSLFVYSNSSSLEPDVTFETVPGEIIVKLKNDNVQLSKDMLKNLKLKRNLKVLSGNFLLLKVQNKASLNKELDRLNRLSVVAYAEPNYIYRAIGTHSVTTNDPKFDQLWGLVNTGNNEPATSRGNSSPRGKAGADINALDAWKITKGSRSIKIAVIDTGIDYGHEDLRDNMWVNELERNGRTGVDDDGNGYVDDIYGYDFAGKDGDPMDGNGHGTHCAGTIAGVHDNNKGVAGVMADAQLIAIKFLNDQGSGSTADAILAIDYATKLGVDIMSNSWGGGGRSQALEDAIQRASDAGIVFTAAAGNNASNNDTIPHYPSNYAVENIISVAAHNYNDQLASFSCYGGSTVHVAAPGRNILSTVPGNKYAVYSGTSMATPHVTGVIGLYMAEHGKSDPVTIKQKIMESSNYSVAYGRKTISGGRVDAYNFLTGVIAPRPATPDPKAWHRMAVDRFESRHPYPVKHTVSKTYKIPGAKFLRIVIRKMHTERKYDYLSIQDADGVEIQQLSGEHNDIVSDYIIGDTLTIEFKSDNSVQEWGFLIDEIEVIQ